MSRYILGAQTEINTGLLFKYNDEIFRQMMI